MGLLWPTLPIQHKYNHLYSAWHMLFILHIFDLWTLQHFTTFMMLHLEMRPVTWRGSWGRACHKFCKFCCLQRITDWLWPQSGLCVSSAVHWPTSFGVGTGSQSLSSQEEKQVDWPCKSQLVLPRYFSRLLLIRYLKRFRPFLKEN